MDAIDCRGLACPGPVIQVKKALELLEPGEKLAVIVDSESSRDNIRRFVMKRGSGFEEETVEEGVFHLTVTAGSRKPAEKPAGSSVVLITGKTVGTGSVKLGKILMEGFVNTLTEQEDVPDGIVLMNEGVELAVEGSVVLGALESLADRGCEILVCGTCLDFYDLKANLQIGTVSNMFDIQQVLLKASSVVRP